MNIEKKKKFEKKKKKKTNGKNEQKKKKPKQVRKYYTILEIFSSFSNLHMHIRRFVLQTLYVNKLLRTKKKKKQEKIHIYYKTKKIQHKRSFNKHT
jgi:L-cysteine desulfidase